MNQLKLSLPNVATEKEVDGVAMGVLEDGTAFMSGSGVARFCGVVPHAIAAQARLWEISDRSGRFAQMLVKQGFERPTLYTRVRRNGTLVNAYADDVSMAFLEYYAFEAKPPNQHAVEQYRMLARASLRQFIYKAVGYQPSTQVPPEWRKFHDRLRLNVVPMSYFSVFREMADIVVTAIQHGLVVDEHTVPDISVGIAWSTFWVSQEMNAQYGARMKHPHVYPDYFPQAAANGSIDAWVYPIEALGAFRVWMARTYLPEKFPNYLQGKVRRKSLPIETAVRILGVFVDGADAHTLLDAG